MNITIEHRIPTVEEYQKLRATTSWDPLSDEAVNKGLEKSLFGICAIHNGEVIGTGRVIGDGAIYFYVQDVIVMEEYKGKGIGKSIMDAINQYLDKIAGENSFIGLMAAKGTCGFYEKFGYSKRSEEGPGMYKTVKKIG